MKNAKTQSLIASVWMLGLFLLYAVVNYLWLSCDNRVLNNFVTNNMLCCLSIRSLSLQGQWFKLICSVPEEAFSLLRLYSPIYYMVGAVASFLVPITFATMYVSNLFYFVIMIVSVYSIGRRLDTPATGYVAATFLSLYPAVYGFSRSYITEFGLAAMVCASVALLLHSRSFQRGRMVVLCGLVTGLSIWMKMIVVPFLIGPFLYAVVYAVRDHYGDLSRHYQAKSTEGVSLKCLVWGGGVLVVVGCLWHATAFDWKGASQIAADVRFHDPAHLFSFSSLSWLSYYWEALRDSQISLVFVVLFILGLVGVLLDKTMTFRVYGSLLLWIAVPYLVFSLMPIKDIRYTIPLLPAVALVSAMGVRRLRWIRYPVMFGAVLLGLVQFWVISFGDFDAGVKKVYPYQRLVPRRHFLLGDYYFTLPYVFNVQDHWFGAPGSNVNKEVFSVIALLLAEYQRDETLMTVDFFPHDATLVFDSDTEVDFRHYAFLQLQLEGCNVCLREGADVVLLLAGSQEHPVGGKNQPEPEVPSVEGYTLVRWVHFPPYQVIHVLRKHIPPFHPYL